MLKTVITGGAGFIGSHLAEELAKQGYHVIILDDLSTGKMENIAGLVDEGKANFVNGSITNLALLERLFQDVDCVFHQAAIPSVSQSLEDPSTSHEVNVTGTLNVLLAARDNSVRKVVYASSSSVYGDTPILPNREDLLPKPQSPYAATKLVGEYYCQVFRQVYGLPTVCLRYFNVYGPRQNPKSQYAAAIPRFIQRINNGDPPVIFGDGKQTRDFLFVKDVVAANILSATKDVYGIFNVGKGEQVTIYDLTELIIKLMGGKKLKPIYHEPRLGDIKYSLADISKARRFGYEPKHSLKAGLKETMDWFLQHYPATLVE